MRPSDWRLDKARADVFMPTVKAILGRIILVEATAFEDETQNTDLKVLVVRGTRVAVRIRDAANTDRRYWDQFTIRTTRPNGAKTELAKIAEGWGDWFFYGIGVYGARPTLVSYVVVDLEAFRRRLINNVPPVRFHDQANRDGSSGFRAFLISDFDQGVIRKRWEMS